MTVSREMLGVVVVVWRLHGDVGGGGGLMEMPGMVSKEEMLGAEGPSGGGGFNRR